MMPKKAFPPPHFPPPHFPPIHNSPATCGALCLALLLTTTGGAQVRPVAPSLPTLPSGVPVGSRQDYDIPSRDPAEEERRLRALNAERQKRVVSDASKILKLTNELSAEIARANSDSLTRSEVRKLAEIEKLARDLKTNMSTTTLPSTEIQSPMDPRLR
jgi:hypothetical protein